MLLPGTCEEDFTLMGKIFRILGALAIAVEILGAPYFQNFWSSKIWKNGSAPLLSYAESYLLPAHPNCAEALSSPVRHL